MIRQTGIAYQYIREKILDGTYRPAQKLVENQLADVIGVSRSTVKKAMLKLEQENLVVIEDNKGATIKFFTSEEIGNYLEIREVLEGLLARSAANNINSSELDNLKTILDAMAIYLQSNKFEEYSKSNAEFHLIIYNANHNTQAVELTTMIKTQLIRYHFRTILVVGRNQNSHQEHTRIYEALLAHDGEAAEAAMKKHISEVRRTILENYAYLL